MLIRFIFKQIASEFFKNSDRSGLQLLFIAKCQQNADYFAKCNPDQNSFRFFEGSRMLIRFIFKQIATEFFKKIYFYSKFFYQDLKSNSPVFG